MSKILFVQSALSTGGFIMFDSFPGKKIECYRRYGISISSIVVWFHCNAIRLECKKLVSKFY